MFNFGKKFLLVLGVLLLVVAVAEAKVVFHLNHFMSPMHPIHVNMLEPMSQEVKEKTEGRVEIVIHPGNALAAPPDCYDAVVSGVAGMGFVLPAYTPGRFPLSQTLEYPFMFTSALQANLTARDITPLLDPELKEAFNSALQAPESDTVSSAEYRWMNWNDGKVERKQVFYQKVDGKTFAVGYYLPRSSEAAAKALLDDAAAAIEDDAEATIARINRLDPEFNRDDLYVFVVDMDSMSMVAHGYSRRLLNIHFPDLKNRDGLRVGQQILDAVEAGENSVTYTWPNPVTERPEEKKTLIRICEKNPEVKVERARLSRSRHTHWDRRGGRLWADRPARLPVVSITPGASYKVFASIDVLRDLNSLGSAVEVTPA